MTQHMNAADWVAAHAGKADSAGTGRKRSPTQRAKRSTSSRSRQGAQPNNAPAVATTKRSPKAAPRLAAVPLAPAGSPTRGPWTVSVQCVEGRPLTVNDERQAAMSFATFKRVREAQAAWKAGFVEAIRHVGLPRIREAHVTLQPYYPNGVVPDADGLAPVVKAALDALVEAGVLTNDKRAQLPLGFLMLPPVSDGGLPRVAMTIHPLS